MTQLSQTEILQWLREEDPKRLQALYARADEIRKRHVGDAIHLRGLIEVSSHCERQCMYCGLRSGNRGIQRYRMTEDEIFECARLAVSLGYGTVVMQAGEDRELTAEWVARMVRTIKNDSPLAVTLSLGERSTDELKLWREAGADRYLLRFETSDASLYRAIHPRRGAEGPDRIALLRELKGMGYEAGGGVMVGIPGQSFESLAHDVATFAELNLDMIGIGPYIPHPATPLGSGALCPPIPATGQVPATEEMVYKMMALTRLVRPDANIPSTTALATINRAGGRMRGLSVGGNVVMPNLTPVKYRALYQIYPAKACIDENASDCNRCLRGQIRKLGRFAGRGAGGRGTLEVDTVILGAQQSQIVQLQR